MNNLITLTQPPVIDYTQMITEAKEIQNRLANYDFENLVITEDNVKEMKQFRASLKKEFTEYEDIRKKLKEAINRPYLDFEKVYNQEFKTVFSDADSKLKIAIDSIENKQKELKEETIREYFESKVKQDWVTFEMIGLRVGLSDSVKSLKDKVDVFIQQVEDDLALIDTQENKERILVEYMRSLNVSKAIATVLESIKREEQLKELAVEKIVVQEKVQQIINEPIQEELQKPIEVKEERLLTINFSVTGTKEQLIRVREFMKEIGVQYE